MKIVLTKDHGYPIGVPTCGEWLRAADADIELLDLSLCSSMEQMENELQTGDALVLTTGPLIPLMRREDLEFEHSATYEQRDEMELKAFDQAVALNMPILGIGRGMRLINVALGGTLRTVVSVHEQTALNHREAYGQQDPHTLVITPGSLLTKITGELEGEVCSTHEQVIEQLAGDLTEAARSPDGMIEAIEWATPQSRPFLFAVAWHPERMAYGNAFSLALAKHFLFEAASYEALVKS